MTLQSSSDGGERARAATITEQTSARGTHRTLVKSITCRDYFTTGAVRTARTCVIEHVPTKARSTVTVREVAHEVDVSDDVFSVAHISDGR